VVIKLAATLANPSVGGYCNAGNYGVRFPATGDGALAPGLRAWLATIHATPSGGYQVTENAFQNAVLSPSENAKVNQLLQLHPGRWQRLRSLPVMRRWRSERNKKISGGGIPGKPFPEQPIPEDCFCCIEVFTRGQPAAVRHTSSRSRISLFWSVVDTRV
jgi:hypothetical protein